jgi:hypothetical protein
MKGACATLFSKAHSNSCDLSHSKRKKTRVTIQFLPFATLSKLNREKFHIAAANLRWQLAIFGFRQDATVISKTGRGFQGGVFGNLLPPMEQGP